MWQSFYEKNNLVYLVNDKNRTIYETNKDNLEEILITKNNIEEIENNIKKIQYVDKKITKLWVLKFPFLALLFSSFFTMPMFFIDVLSVRLMLFVGTSGFFAVSCASFMDSIKSYKENKLSNKLCYNLLLDEKEKELEKLKHLESISKNKIVEKVEHKTISRSEMIKNLERKLELINDYSKDRDFFINCYKTDSLHTLTQLYEYKYEDILFIKNLIEEDLKNKIENNTNQKIKVKNKNTD